MFIDDSYLQGATKEQCNQNVNATINLLISLGFTIHTKKSGVEPAQSIKFLGFVIIFTTMSVKINADKSKNMLNKIETFPSNLPPKITALVSVNGTPPPYS